MAGPVDDLPISLAELQAAVATRDLPGLVARLVRERSWGALVALFGHAAGAPAPALALGDLETAARALAVALDAVPTPKNARAPLGDELRAVRIAAAEALLARGAHPPVAETERRARRRAAGLLSAAGDHARAAGVHEELGDDASAAESWGALGELDRMEAAHARDDARLGRRRAATDAAHRFDALLTAGERRLAVATAGEDASLRLVAAGVESRLVRARGVTLRVRGGTTARFAALPAVLGRDPLAEIALRDPGVSRRHAVIRRVDAELLVEDLGSRGGLRLAGARLEGSLPLRGQGELGLGAATALRFSAEDGAVLLHGTAGLDRDLVALASADPLPLSRLVAGADGVALELASGAPRLVRRADVPVRVGGHFVGPGCDLCHGDVVEILGATSVVFEVA